MLKKPSAILILVSALFFCTSTFASAQEQPDNAGVIDGVTVGIGLSKFFAEVDAVRGVSGIQHIAQSRAHLMAGVDRELEHFRLGLEANYQNFDGRHQVGTEAIMTVEGDVFGLDVILSRGLDLLQPDYFRIYLGLGGSFVAPEYTLDGDLMSDDAQHEDVLEGTDAHQQILAGERSWEDTSISFHLQRDRFMISVPVGIMIQNRLRLGVRLFGNDYVDGVRANGSPWDYLTNLTIGWRFNI